MKVIFVVSFLLSFSLEASLVERVANKMVGQYSTENCHAFNSYTLYGYGNYALVSIEEEYLRVDIIGEKSHSTQGVTATFYFDLLDQNVKRSNRRGPYNKLIRKEEGVMSDTIQIESDGTLLYRKYDRSLSIFRTRSRRPRVETCEFHLLPEGRELNLGELQ